MSKKLVGAIVAILVLLVGVYIGSPYWALHTLKTAAIEADTDKLDAAVDFPAVRESLKAQFTSALMTKMTTSPEMKGNPFAGLGAMLVPAMVNQMVDAFVTPDGMSAVIRGQKPGEAKKVSENPNLSSTTEYVSLDRFRVRLRNRSTNDEGPSLLLERRGFASWKLIRVEMPAGMFENKPSA